MATAKKTVVWMPLGDETVPSSRIRSLTIARRLQSSGDIENVFPPFDLSSVPAALFVEKKCGPQTLEIVNTLKTYGTRIVYDLCDPIWLQDDINRQRNWKPYEMLKLADRVTVPTKQLKSDLLTKYPDIQVTVIPDVLEFEEKDFGRAVNRSENDEVFRIGWIGTSLNMEHIPLAASGIQTLSEKQNIVFRIITKAHQGLVTAIPRVKTEYCPWALDTWKNDLCECDCVIIPMNIRETTRTKSNNRLQLCLALGLPVAASPIPSYLDLMQNDPGIVEFVTQSGEWLDALNKIKSSQNSVNMSIRGVEFARKYINFSLVEPLWRKILCVDVS